VAEDEVG